uniref:Uncharacterized protein n=1 Tax=Strombidium rassoulzadegani TaxID=1082188 RepID=A0A7S3CIJ6_9SPIT|mmetsp:Transcript_1187/g.2175  ORF Transcript_1187/g.2175 Transcript_1187/m.2175 type:complete len:151 (+) Transcript_1187:33-485(+)
MVYIRLPTFKTGINPSVKHRFTQTGDYTPTEKLTLTRNRIWGNVIGNNMRSGYKELSSPSVGQFMGMRYDQGHLKLMHPFLKDWSRMSRKRDKFHLRKNRVFMRGIKIGKKQSNRSLNSMKMFEMSGGEKFNAEEIQQTLIEDAFDEDQL